jgi:glycosyltransferase involved in cell wall biosynthesis
MKTGPIRVAVYGWYIPGYRRALFETLAKEPGFEFTFHAPRRAGKDFIKRSSSEAKFDWRDEVCVRLPIPFTDNKLTFFPGLLPALLGNSHDVFVLPNDLLGIDVWLALLLRRGGPAVCLWGHGYSKRASGWKDRFRRVLGSAADALILYTEQTRTLWEERGLDKSKLFVAHNALDTERSQSIAKSISPSALAEFQESRGLVDRPIALFVGRLIPSKRPELFVRALGELRKRIPNALGIVIGDGPLRGQLMESIARDHLEEHVRLTGDIYDEQLLARYFLSSRACVAPSGAGLVVQHAFGYGVPMIVGDDYGSHGPEAALVIHQGTGLVVPSEDCSALASAMQVLLAEDVTRRACSSNCMQLIACTYNIHNMAKGIVDAVRFAASPQSPGVSRAPSKNAAHV